MSSNNVLQMIDVTRSFAGASPVVRSLNLRLASGQGLLVTGTNGSGKSTLLRLVAALIEPSCGQVLVGSFCTAQQSQKARSLVSYSPASDRSFIPRLDGRKNLEFFAKLSNLSHGCFQQRLQALQEFQWTLKSALDQPYYLCSTGMRQSLSIARALMQDSKMIVLDEPERGLDRSALNELFEILKNEKQKGRSLVVSTHQPELFGGLFEVAVDLNA